MNHLTDQQLLRDYVERRSESAFAELVRRHVDLVYSAALRMVCDSHLAQDVTQNVFIALAKNAGQLTARPVLSGWLHRTAQNIAVQTVRTEVRRHAREQEAVAMNELLASESEAQWEKIAPHLDSALGELNESDRDAVLLRYFENKSAREMAQILGTSDDAAQKRVSRAVERLREFFAKRGVTPSASGLVVVISANAVQAAPVGLAVTISTAALAGTGIAATTATLTKTIAMSTIQKTLVAATLVVAVGTGIFETREASELRHQSQILQQKQALLVEEIQKLQREHDNMTERLAELSAENGRLQSNPNQNELLKLRGEVGVLQQKATELGSLKQDERLAFTTEDVFKLHQMHSSEAMGKIIEAVKKFSKIHGGKYPRNFEELKASVEIASTNLAGNLGFRDFVFLAPGTVDFQGTPMILRNRDPIINPQGESIWVYGSINTNGIPSTQIMAVKYGG